MVKLATINTTYFGPLAELLEAEDCILEDAAHIICVQEHHLAQDKISGFQARMKQAGYHGVWGAAAMTDSPTGRGTSGGVCVMCPTTVQITKPPMLAKAVLVPSRAIAAHLHTAFKAGVVVISVYLWVDEDLGPKNLALLMEVSRYIQKLQALGYDWVV